MTAPDLFVVDGVLPVIAHTTGLSVYDFDFRAFLPCRHPFAEGAVDGVVARMGAFDDYAKTHASLRNDGISLIHDPVQHLRASTLPGWYPAIAELTPKSVCFDARPTADDIEATVGWPAFLKGARQTSRHTRAASIVASRADLPRALRVWEDDPVLRWQQVVCRQLIDLRPVEDPDPARIPSSFEFRCFFWRGKLVGGGRYWWQGVDYAWSEDERRDGERLATEAAARVDVPFLVVDIAQARDGRWWVIECNDGQESGYAGVSPFALWQRIVDAERVRDVG